jgi:signal transduction histidine kinase
VVEVRDDGVGIVPEALEAAARTGHVGLALARSRVLEAGGTWSLAPGEDGGTIVRASLPVPPVAPSAPARGAEPAGASAD